jgi:hypothetical protein
MKKIFILASVFLIAAVLMNGCSKNSTTNTPITCTLSVSFSTNIKKILDLNCNSCHAPGSGNALALARWTYDGTYANALGNKDNINAQVSVGLMPQTGPLPQVVRDSIGCWVVKGAPN